MSDTQLKVSDLVDYPEKRFIEVKDVISKLSAHQKEYTEMDTLYDIEGLERLKRDVSAQLELLANHYAIIKRFKTAGDFLEETRKFIKSEAIELIMENKKVSANQAEKLVYAEKYYKDRVDLMQKTKSFFIKIEILYRHYENLLSSIVQSISLCKKDPNYKNV